MDTFPYESWEEAIADAVESGGANGYFTWAQSDMSVVLALLGIALAAVWMLWLTRNETNHLNECAGRLNEKWGIN